MDDLAHARGLGPDLDDDRPQRGRLRSFLILFLILAVVAGAAFAYWLHARHFETTDDAAIDGHVSQVAAEVDGQVIALLADDNQPVTQGQLLLRIDPSDYRIRLQQALAQQIQAQAQLRQAEATLSMRQADAAEAQSRIRAADADLEQSDHDLARYRSLDPRAITRQTLDTAVTTENGARARRDATRHVAEGMAAQIDAAGAAIDAARAALRLADAQVADAKLKLAYTEIRAPASGRIARRTVELGDYIKTGQPLLAIVQPDLWITANFKETQLTDMKPGQPVTVRVDAFPSQPLPAHVASIQPGTGSVFSALPAENATGNYVKVVQRVPVKILFDGKAWRQLPLVPGMSVVPQVRVR